MRALTFAFLALFASPITAQEAVQPEQTFVFEAKEPVRAERFMVAAAHPLAVEAGHAVLAEGGTAADALVAVQLVLNLVEPQSSGIGGGAFLLYWDAASKTLTTLDGRETAPAAATPEYWFGPDGHPVGWWEAVVGGRSVGVPGTLKLIDTAQSRWGKAEWTDLIVPAQRIAEDGFEVSLRLSASVLGASANGLGAFEPAASYFFNSFGLPVIPGTTLKNPEFAETLQRIAERRSAAMYDGPLAERIVAATRTDINPGILTVEDIRGYQVIERAPVCVPYRGYDVCGMGPPSSGGLTVGQILGLLEHFDMASMGPGSNRAAEGRHLLAEAAKLAYADRAKYMADSDFVPMPTRGLLDPAYLTARAQLIDSAAAGPVREAGNPPWRAPVPFLPDTDGERPGTSHISIVDGEGNVASMTTTIETGFGSRVMVGGFLLNNELTDFSRAPSRDGRPIANRVESGKRPRSSMAPTIVMRDGVPVLSIGSPGGSRIIGYVAQAIVAILDWGLDPQEAFLLPNVVNRNGATDVELGAGDLAGALRDMGHDVTEANLNSGLHGIAITGRGLIGGADPRREGIASGE